MEKTEEYQRDMAAIQSLAGIVAKFNFWISTKLVPPALTPKDRLQIFRLRYKLAGGPNSLLDAPATLATSRQQEGADIVFYPPKYNERPNVIKLRGSKGTVVLSSSLFGSQSDDILKCVRRNRPVINYRMNAEDSLPYNLMTLGQNGVKVFDYIAGDTDLYPSEVSLVDSPDSFEEVVKQFA